MKLAEETGDTILVKKRNDLTASYETGLYSKSYFYYWVVGNDTLNLHVSANEYKKDSSLHLYILHEEPVLFKILLQKINSCLSLIKEDFYLTKLSSLYFKSPVYYPDMAKELSGEYEQSFGKKNISIGKLNQFLLKSWLNTQLNGFLYPLDKKVERYSIEKFQIVDKKEYKHYLPNVDLSDYPGFTIEGMGVSVQLESK